MYVRLSKEILPEMIADGMKIVMAISGGPDSLAMGHILWRFVREHHRDVELAVSHINHGVRPEATAEETMVKEMAARWGLPFWGHRFQAREYARTVGKSFQEAARDWRYMRLAEDMAEHGFTVLATAHHLNDQAETVLYRLLRGGGAAGLAGIYPHRSLTVCRPLAAPSLAQGTPWQVIRPLLTVRKEELVAYCREQDLPYAVDASNADTGYERNRIRLELIPYLEREYNPRVQEALSRTAEVLRWDEAYFQDILKVKWECYGQEKGPNQAELSWGAWREPPAILARLLRRAIAIACGDPRGIDHKFIELLMRAPRPRGWQQDLPGLQARAEAQGLVLSGRKGKPCPHEADVRTGDLVLRINTWTEDPGTGREVGLFTEAEGQALPSIQEARVKIDLVLPEDLLAGRLGPIEYRRRRPGDWMYWAGTGRKRLKKIWQEQNIPLEQRDHVPMLAVGSRVLAIPALAVIETPANRKIKEKESRNGAEAGSVPCCLIVK